MHFHGHDAKYGIDKHQTGDGNISGLDVAAQTMASAQRKNVVAIFPQGVLGGGHSKKGPEDRSDEGGFMAGLRAGLPTFLESVLTTLAADLKMDSLTPGHIALAGHSAGGYLGINEALDGAGGLADAITDITLMDTGYAESHFKNTAHWMFQGKPGKSVRIIGSSSQINAKGHGAHDSTFGSGLADLARAHGMTVEHDDIMGEKRDDFLTGVSHSRVMKDGVVQGDVLILKYDKTHNGIADHQPLRDAVLDDAMLSIGEGSAGNAEFGKHHQNKPHAAKGKHAENDSAHHEEKPKAAELDGSLDGKRVTPDDVHAIVTSTAPQVAPAVKAADPEATHEDKQAAKPGTPISDGIIGDKVREHGAATDQGDVHTNQDPALKSWVHDTNDATSVFPEKLTKLYEHCMAAAKAGTLIFPSTKEPLPGVSSEPLTSFIHAFYAHFGVKERRINIDIMKHGGKQAIEWKAYLESLLGDHLPAQYCHPNKPGQRVHKAAQAAFITMHEAAARDGVDLRIVSGYRPPERHKVASENAFARADNSSHNYGLALDLELSVDKEHTQDHKSFDVKETNTHFADNTMKFSRSSVTKWMVLNCMKFGFVPYMNEPWHYEYNPEGMAAEIVEGAKAFKTAR